MTDNAAASSQPPMPERPLLRARGLGAAAVLVISWAVIAWTVRQSLLLNSYADGAWCSWNATRQCRVAPFPWDYLLIILAGIAVGIGAWIALGRSLPRASSKFGGARGPGTRVRYLAIAVEVLGALAVVALAALGSLAALFGGVPEVAVAGVGLLGFGTGMLFSLTLAVGTGACRAAWMNGGAVAVAGAGAGVLMAPSVLTAGSLGLIMVATVPYAVMLGGLVFARENCRTEAGEASEHAGGPAGGSPGFVLKLSLGVTATAVVLSALGWWLLPSPADRSFMKGESVTFPREVEDSPNSSGASVPQTTPTGEVSPAPEPSPISGEPYRSTRDPRPSAVSAPCTSAQVEMNRSPVNGALGARQVRITLTNRGATACSVRGMPGVWLSDAGRQGDSLPSTELTTTELRTTEITGADSSAYERGVELPPGDSATMEIEWRVSNSGAIGEQQLLGLQLSPGGEVIPVPARKGDETWFDGDITLPIRVGAWH
ncbi:MULTISPECIES: DUF4232 domain-containing protein [Actinomycetaceae]|uniref:DUF4232 domain-containing protein n=1 Tax=Actinomycetaceae TaxID=2049 RepID=UPI00237D679D|nr:DUF4232 domain-containing protein [Actinotignum sanguinis]MDE1642690.1 DUF4232 domain-containing protein [Actinotignum sanguinis]